MPHPENPNLANLLRKKQEVQLPWPSKLGQCQQDPFTIGLKSELSSPSCQPRLTSLFCPLVYYQSSPLLGGQPTKANKPHLPKVNQVILRQVPAVTLSFWWVSRGYHMDVEVSLSGNNGPAWTSLIPASSEYVDSIYPQKLT